ncbi:apoptosis inhibitor 5-like protein API5 [Bidens hawaiensis]|uniref:apoptosis inhibitor 5-like protein API5 n=1 Tax=Bidens hawaiensis TaxID=980011 RepID=UPI00404AEB07
MADDASGDIEKLYEYGERLNEAKDKSQNVEDYKNIIASATSTNIKARQLAAQLIPRFFKFFPGLSGTAVDAHLDLCEAEELGIRVQAICGLPLFCKDTPEHIPKIVDILAQLLIAEENVERDAVHKALLLLLRQDVKASLTALFKHIESVDEPIADDNRERTLTFIRDKVFPIKSELLKPQEQMERHITDLIKKSLQDVTGAEFKMFMDFLKSLNIFGDKAPTERTQELIEIIESQADLDAQFDVSDGDHIDRLISCLFHFSWYVRGASSSKFINYLNKNIIPTFDKLPEERKVDLLKNLAECSPYSTPQDSRHILPSIVQLLKKYMPSRKTGEEMNFTYVECLLYTFHHLANKAPNATNSLCGYKIVTGQPSDRLGEDFSEFYKDFTERLKCVEELAKATKKKLTQGMAQQNKTMATAISDEEKANIKTQKQNATTGLRTCNNILAMTQPLHSKSPSFIGDKRINLSWKEAVKTVAPSPNATGVKRAASTTNGSGNNANKRGRGGGSGGGNQLVLRAFEGISHGGRGGSRGGGWGRRGGRGRGRERGVLLILLFQHRLRSVAE